MTCRKCEDFTNKNIEGFVISKSHTCLKLDPEGSLIESEDEEEPRPKIVYRSAVHSDPKEFVQSNHHSSVKKEKRSHTFPRQQEQPPDTISPRKSPSVSRSQSDSFMKYGNNDSYIKSYDSKDQREDRLKRKVLAAFQRDLILKKMCFYELKGNWAVSQNEKR